MKRYFWKHFKLVFAVPLLAATAAQADNLDTVFVERLNNSADIFTLGRFISQATDAGEFDQAISTLEDYLVRFPRDGRARLAAGKLYVNLGSWDVATQHLTVAIESGDLDAEEANEAKDLLARAEAGASGIEWALGVTVGIGVGIFDVEDDTLVGEFSDRTDFTPFANIDGAVRFGLNSPLDDAIVVSGNFNVERRFEDVFLGAPFIAGVPSGDVFTSTNGRAAVTFDKGLPVTFVDAARFQLTGFLDYRTFNPDIDDIGFGVEGQFLVQASVDSTLFLRGSYANLGASNNLPVDSRFNLAFGFEQRFSANHSAGIAYKGALERVDGDVFAFDNSVELAYAGRLPFQPFDLIWTHEVITAVGLFDADNLIPGFPDLTGYRAEAAWEHHFHIDGSNRIDLGYRIRSIQFNEPAVTGNSSLTHTLTASYTRRF